MAGESASSIIRRAGQTIAERHCADKLIILQRVMPKLNWPKPMTDILPPELRVADEGRIRKSSIDFS
jgi:hypothetical protein